ncbi:MAG TPA: 3-oxoacyl-[acyl-carrier-protein] synthase III C-terminal domain-containing protein [Polyangia bacterium]|jgi:3-oxoacyl-[acyl-carrier-protein] synthase-3|nr:3-oxoacyl-[acyl-carrier-protein] synthase III C-terminal domain-containing protein [Polyangia bacterium]
MRTVSLIGVASYLPENVVTNEFFAPGAADRRGMFTAPTTRRHVRRDESAAEMIERASRRLIANLGLDTLRDIDIIFTNVTVPDQPFTGCGAEVAHRIGARPRWVVDLHNSGCVSFIYMMELARVMMTATDARGALLCNVQNAAGRVFSNAEVRLKSQAPVPGDGCGVGYLAPSNVSPILSVAQQCHGEYAGDMSVSAEDGRRYWEPGPSPISVAFSDERVASIISRGNRIVPEVVRAACDAAGARTRDIKLLITNQPNPIFLRNWREALELSREAHHDTFDRYGNLFGAAIPINLEDALAHDKLQPGDLLALGGFSHAGDYTAAAVVRWRAGAGLAST